MLRLLQSQAFLVPANGGKSVISPSVPITTSIVASKPSSGSFSVQSISSKMNDIINPQKAKPKLKNSGSCGDGVTYVLENGVLTISGSGAITNEFFPRGDFESVIINSGVTSIGDDAFSDCSALTSVTIGNSVTSIGDYAFYYCKSLDTINFNGNQEPIIGNEVFDNCDKLKTINVPSTYEGNEFGGVVVKKSADSVDPVNPENPANPVDLVNPEEKNVQGNSSSTTSKSSKLSGGAIAGIVVGSVAAVAAATVGTILLLKHKAVKVCTEEVPT